MKNLLSILILLFSLTSLANAPIIPEIRFEDETFDWVCCERNAYYSVMYYDNFYSGTGKAIVCREWRMGGGISYADTHAQACDDALKVADAEAKRNLAAAIAAGPQ